MLLTALPLRLATADLSTTAEPPADELTWAFDSALTSPSLVGLSFNPASSPPRARSRCGRGQRGGRRCSGGRLSAPG
jgi:hypothetical protein